VNAASVGGGGGIRTHGSLRFTRFPSAPIRPLSHPSESSLRRMRRVNDGRLSEHRLRCLLTRRPTRATISLSRADASSSEVAVGSCATDARESGQVRKEAAFIGR
jgi:hypothetical protein